MADQDRQQEMEEQLGAIRDFLASPPGWIFAGVVATAILIGIVLTGFPGVLGPRSLSASASPRSLLR